MFLDAMGGATPLGTRDRVPLPPKPVAIKVDVLPAEVKLAVEGSASRYSARAPGVNSAQVEQLRRAPHIDATLDLHGDTTAEGVAKLRAFVAEPHRIVRVIHGKGTGALREAVLAELLGSLSGYVHALTTAAPGDGGEGATILMLRGKR